MHGGYTEYFSITGLLFDQPLFFKDITWTHPTCLSPAELLHFTWLFPHILSPKFRVQAPYSVFFIRVAPLLLQRAKTKNLHLHRQLCQQNFSFPQSHPLYNQYLKTEWGRCLTTAAFKHYRHNIQNISLLDWSQALRRIQVLHWVDWREAWRLE